MQETLFLRSDPLALPICCAFRFDDNIYTETYVAACVEQI